MNMKKNYFAFMILFLSVQLSLTAQDVLPLKKRAEVVNNWLTLRLEKVVPEVMKREGIDMWVVMCREYNEDPVYFSLMPQPNFFARRLSVIIFSLNKEGVFEKIMVSKENFGGLYKVVWKKEWKDQWEAIANIISERDPQKIGLNYSEDFNFGDGITSTLKDKFMKSIDKKYAARVVSADHVAIGWLETRIAQEMEAYPQIVLIAHNVIAEAFSTKVITPGITTSDDVEWWIREKFSSLSMPAWFQPSIDIIRRNNSEYKTSNVIHRGDMLHCDIGLTYLGLNTDTQQLAYILKEGETDAPEGLKKGLAEGNRLQDIVMTEMKTGLTGNQILKTSIEKAKAEGLTPCIYAHALGFHGHGAGLLIGLYDSQGGVPGRGDYKLFPNTCHSIELNVRTAVPEWDNQMVTFSLEQDAFFDGTKAAFIDKRQTKFYLVK